jgi:hypothetical protein
MIERIINIFCTCPFVLFLVTRYAVYHNVVFDIDTYLANELRWQKISEKMVVSRPFLAFHAPTKLLIISVHICIYIQCSNWEKLSRGAQSNDLKTAFHVRNYLTQTRGGFVPLPPPTTLNIFWIPLFS